MPAMMVAGTATRSVRVEGTGDDVPVGDRPGEEVSDPESEAQPSENRGHKSGGLRLDVCSCAKARVRVIRRVRVQLADRVIAEGG
jgi:hypothetical protein